MRVRKLPYYARALAALVAALENPQALARLGLGRPAELRLRGGLRLQVASALDALVLEETVLADVYGLGRLASPRCIADVGAGSGDFCLEAARRFPDARVLAFEPAPEAFERLRGNVLRNRLRNVEIHPVAVGKREHYAVHPHPHGARTVGVTDGGEVGAAVPGCRLADVLPGHVDLLKIDCEGAELDVLESLGPEAAGRVGLIVLEFHEHLVPGQAGLLTRRLSELGYRCHRRPDPFDARIGLLEARREVGPRSPDERPGR